MIAAKVKPGSMTADSGASTSKGDAAPASAVSDAVNAVNAVDAVDEEPSQLP